MAYALLIVIAFFKIFFGFESRYGFFLFPSKNNQEGKLKYFTSVELSGLQNLYRTHKHCIKYQLHNSIG